MSHFAQYFHDSRSYKISSVVDGSVLDLAGAKAKNGKPILTYHWGDTPNQTWKAADESSGFRLATNVQSSALMVLDEASGQELCIWTFHGNDNQQWRCVPIYHGEGAVMIQNVRSGHCIRNMGEGNQLKCTEQAIEDRSQWWYLVEV